MTHRSTRRDFLKHMAMAGAGYCVAAGMSPAQPRSPNEQLAFACIGVGGKGSSDTDQVSEFGNIVALCDIDEKELNAKAQKFPKAKKYRDFRKLLEEMGKSVDAVTVSTADHTHAHASILAMRQGKHVYCQKPLTHSVWEARQMRETAASMKVCTQMGNQGTAHDNLRTAVEVIQSGAIGPVHEVHVWTDRPGRYWPQAPHVLARPAEATPPSHVDWDLWIGPAPFRPYAVYGPEVKARQRQAYHPFNWRGWWDFGTGALGDMGCHTANLAFMALQLKHPSSVAAEGSDVNPETCPSWATITLQFPRRGDGPHQQAVKLFWYEGQRHGQKNLPSLDLLHGEKPPGSGSILVGDKGALYSPSDYGASYKLLPAKDFVDFKPPASKLPRNGKGDTGMKAEWVEAIRAGKPEMALSNFDYAGHLTEAILLGNVALRAGKTLEWDGPNLKATNCAEAAQYIRRAYRKGWEL